ncbi:MAG: DUF4011 domain-containing protein, partial [Candidatus Obscuribacterales bacterium]|nr:DUF4011 domain-containing protein [Candidatus Obscuribacterales bacterium]
MDEITGSTVSANNKQASLNGNQSEKLGNESAAAAEQAIVPGKEAAAKSKAPIRAMRSTAKTGKKIISSGSRPADLSKQAISSESLAKTIDAGSEQASAEKDNQSAQTVRSTRQVGSKKSAPTVKANNPLENFASSDPPFIPKENLASNNAAGIAEENSSANSPAGNPRENLASGDSAVVPRKKTRTKSRVPKDGFDLLLEEAKAALEQNGDAESQSALSDEQTDFEDLSPENEDDLFEPETQCQNGHSLRSGELFCLICGLSERTENVQKKVREANISIDESILLKVLVLTSREHLESEWERRRKLLPDSEHEYLASLLERKHLSEEELIILLCASPDHFITADQLLENAAALSLKVLPRRPKGNPQNAPAQFDKEAAAEYLSLSKSQIYASIDARLGDFARCGIEAIDNWADTYRLERALSLDKCLVLLAVPEASWLKLPKHQYINEILKFGERRIMATINQGPLVLLRVTRNSSTLDIRELGASQESAERILEHLLSRTTSAIDIEAEAFEATPSLERRIRGLVQKTTIFRRDTGKHSLFLGFPFVVLKTRSADENKTKLRVAPVFLFPVRIDAQIGSRGKVSISSSQDRDEVRLNPALAGILELGPKDEEKWKLALDEIMNQSGGSSQFIVDLLSRFLESADQSLVNIPGKETVAELGNAFLSYSGALFHCDFTGKAVADDLRNICDQPIAGTALELALRVAPAGEPQSSELEEAPAAAFDLADHGVIAADPSQEIAVQQSRNSRGLHIEGPPGTGKSQTIVNIIADCVARNETALVVCQKQAALTVVEKRLKAEGLGRRLFYITDISRDRQSVIRALREQLDERAAGIGAPVAQLRKDRASLMSRLQSLDADINKHHSALHDIDSRVGLSYRNILAELIRIDAVSPSLVKIPRLRAILKDYDNAGVSALIEECVSIANLWLESKFEISPLQDLKVFSPDEADAQLIRSEFTRFARSEEHRFSTLAQYPKSADVDDISVYVNWLKENEEYIRGIQKDVRLNLSKWVSNFFEDGVSRTSVGNEAINALMQVSDALSKLNRDDHSPQLFAALAKLPTPTLRRKIAMAKSAIKAGGALDQINPIRAFNRYALKNYLKALGHPANDTSMLEFLRTAKLELELRTHREVYERVSRTLRLDPVDTVLDLQRLQHAVSILLSQLAPVAELASKLRSCPLPDEAREFARRAESTAFDEFNYVLKGVIKRHAAKTESLNSLSRLSEYFDDEWLQAQKRVISAGRGNIEAVRYMQRFLLTIVPYQEFRLRAKSLSPQALETFALLREHEAELLASSDFNPRSPQFDLLGRIRNVIRREACLAWKSQLETEEPARTIAKEEITYKVTSLAESDEVLRKLNKKILAEPSPDAPIAAPKKWEDITRLSGARARRLRELISNGTELGLMNLRPIWLMNPETASRLLPLTAGLFDAVIFDEASQLLVEYAIPCLFRAKRAIVSGDEKQMPPPNFFAARVQNDETFEPDEDIDEYLPQAELDRIEEAWNRREIKDCPDLLNLASAVLPSRSLQIHYRSEYRELIAFSNSAFYSGTLSIPSRRPANEV